eukprot:5585890-Prymnesium_polylepis.2
MAGKNFGRPHLQMMSGQVPFGDILILTANESEILPAPAARLPSADDSWPLQLRQGATSRVEGKRPGPLGSAARSTAPICAARRELMCQRP